MSLGNINHKIKNRNFILHSIQQQDMWTFPHAQWIFHSKTFFFSNIQARELFIITNTKTFADTGISSIAFSFSLPWKDCILILIMNFSSAFKTQKKKNLNSHNTNKKKKNSASKMNYEIYGVIYEYVSFFLNPCSTYILSCCCVKSRCVVKKKSRVIKYFTKRVNTQHVVYFNTLSLSNWIHSTR